MRRLLPIPCVDVLPRDRDGRYLLIRRLDRHGKEGWNLVGGRIRVGETPDDAIARHLRDTLGSSIAWDKEDWQSPDLVAEYVHADQADVPFDPQQHAISLTYVVPISGEAVAQGEALSCAWFAPDSLPALEEFGFNQGLVAHQLLKRSTWTLPHDDAMEVLGLVEQRRLSTNQLMWEVPALALTAQAFLLTIVLDPAVSAAGRAIAAGVGSVLFFVNLHLFRRHRQLEMGYSMWLEAFEKRNGLPPIHREGELYGPESIGMRSMPAPGRSLWSRIRRSTASSFQVWKVAMWILLIGNVALLVLSLTGTLY